jgi:hypothetical protein
MAMRTSRPCRVSLVQSQRRVRHRRAQFQRRRARLLVRLRADKD